MSDTHSTLHAFVSGYVQGVGYRYFARQHAQTLGLAGYARNLHNGRVEVVAQGPRESLQRFVEALRRGPEGASVDNVEVSWEPRDPTKQPYVGFGILR